MSEDEDINFDASVSMRSTECFLLLTVVCTHIHKTLLKMMTKRITFYNKIHVTILS